MNCYLCHKPKATLDCGLCTEHICKNCARFLPEETFSFLKTRPAHLCHTTFCEPCYHNSVEPEFTGYEETLAKAKNVLVFSKTQGKETRLIKRIELPVEVKKCDDYDETILRLAFYAAQSGHNAIIDVDVTSEKIRVGGYQSSEWTGKGVPAQVTDAKLIKDRSTWSDPN
ncbi:MAG: hypothetical protein H7328_00585 [Bdellovibrio sp.]|nr:hypothetical protein [Bdellovibrio sp.]